MSFMRSDVEPTADSYPYVTGMGFRNRAHLIFDEFQKDGASSISADGQVAFVKTDFVRIFFMYIVPRLQYKVKIITHNSALGIDEKFRPWLDHPKIVCWYAQNANIEHPKLQSVPLGLANRRWAHGSVEQIESTKDVDIERTNLVYMNFDVGTNSDKRTSVFNLFSGKKYVTQASPKPFDEYLRDLKESKYVLSPPGAGHDCHRIWESLIMGAVPIVEAGQNISFYRHLPIMIVEDWHSVTDELLEKKYQNFIEKMKEVDCLSMDYWIQKIGLKEGER